MQWRVGTMGFSYSDWQPVFYPPGTKPGDYLATYATAFDTVELDTTFHAVPPLERVQKWVDAVPADFRFCPKVPKSITHENPIAFGSAAMRVFLKALAPMRKAEKLGPVLIQFPPTFTASEFRDLEVFLKELPQGVRYAVEFRHASWEMERTGQLLAEHRCCWVTGDYGVDPFPIHPTTDFLYIRFIGIHDQFATHERERIDMTDRLAWWKEQADAAGLGEAFVMMNNDYAGHSPATANRLKRLAGLSAKEPPRPADAAQPGLF